MPILRLKSKCHLLTFPGESFPFTFKPKTHPTKRQGEKDPSPLPCFPPQAGCWAVRSQQGTPHLEAWSRYSRRVGRNGELPPGFCYTGARGWKSVSLGLPWHPKSSQTFHGQTMPRIHYWALRRRDTLRGHYAGIIPPRSACYLSLLPQLLAGVLAVQTPISLETPRTIIFLQRGTG